MTRASLDFSGFITSRTKDFTGREWVFFAINTWLADEGGKRVFLLTGEPGCGKSALASCLVQLSQDKLSAPANCPALKPNFLSAFHFCSASKQTWINPHTFTTSLALQLADHYPVYAQALAELNKDERIHIEVHQTAQQIHDRGKQIGVYIENLDVSHISAEDAFVRTVCEPLTVLATKQPNQQIVILVDALDEALVYTGQRTIVALLARTEELPSNVRFLLTSRQEPQVENEFLDTAGLFVSADKNRDQNDKDIYQYVTAQFREVSNLKTMVTQLKPDEQQKAINTIVDKADGNFRYITFLLAEMTNGQRQLTDLQGLPADLDGLYYQSLERLVQQGKRSWSDDYAPICGILSVAQDSLTLSQLGMLIKQPEDTLWSHLTDLQQFVEDVTPAAGTDVEVVYRLYHQSVADFLRRRYIRLEGKQSKNKYYLAAERWHRQISDSYRGQASTWAQADWRTWDAYGLRNLVGHIVATGQADEIKGISELFSCSSYLDYGKSILGSEIPFLNDVILMLANASPTETIELGYRILYDAKPNSHRALRTLKSLVHRTKTTPCLQETLRAEEQNKHTKEMQSKKRDSSKAVMARAILILALEGQPMALQKLRTLLQTAPPTNIPMIYLAYGLSQDSNAQFELFGKLAALDSSAKQHGRDYKLGWYAAEGLRELGRERCTKDTIEALVRMLESRHALNQTLALYILSRWGEHDAAWLCKYRETINNRILLGLQQRKSERLCANAADAVWLLSVQLPRDKALSLLKRVLGLPTDKWFYAKKRAAAALGKIAPHDQNLLDLLRGHYEEVNSLIVKDSDIADCQGLKEALAQAIYEIENRTPEQEPDKHSLFSS